MVDMQLVEMSSTVELKQRQSVGIVQSEALPWSLITCRSLSSDLQESKKRVRATKLCGWTPNENSRIIFLAPHIFLTALKLCNHLNGVSTLEFSKSRGERLSSVLTCSAVKCVLQSSLPATSWVVFPVLWPSRSLSDLIQLQKKKKRLGKVSDAQIWLTVLQCFSLILMCCRVF